MAQFIVAGVDGVTVDLTTSRLGHGVSSRRYKEGIKPMDKASEALFALEPVTYRYKKDIDPNQTLDYGLVAEDVAKVTPSWLSATRRAKSLTIAVTRSTRCCSTSSSKDTAKWRGWK